MLMGLDLTYQLIIKKNNGRKAQNKIIKKYNTGINKKKYNFNIHNL